MVSVVRDVAVGCADAYALARFWSGVTGGPLGPEDKPGHPETLVTLPTGLVLYFNQVPVLRGESDRAHSG
ncbi:VOC family protein [Streptomyces sp. 4F14]|uniref:VOC family protein n=1 Tax=Streptomyces sp. 4F14 TaxID=3394380 RepID=UPI003A856340